MMIFLVGMPGSGKTTLGKALAKALAVHFVDLDEVIEEEEGQSIASIFAQRGERYFREAESKALTEIISQYQEAVISTGGGAPCFGSNMELIASSGISIFLNVAPDQLAERLRAMGLSDRPKLRHLNQDELENYLSRQLGERSVFYQQADLILSGDNLSVQQLLTELEEFKKRTPQSK